MTKSQFTKIRLINNEKFIGNREIDISDSLRVSDIKYSMGGGDVAGLDLGLDLVYKNCVLNESRAISFYNIRENEEIWIGRIEEYLTKTDVIVDVLVVGPDTELLHLVATSHSTVFHILTLVQQIFPGLTHRYLWQTDGLVLGLDKTVADIKSGKGGHKIILQSTNGITVEKSFEECRQIHDRYLIERYFSGLHKSMINNIRDQLVVEPHMKKEMMHILDKLMKDQRFNAQLSSFPESFRESTFLFCMRLAERTFLLYRDQLILHIERFLSKTYDQLVDCVRMVLRVLVLDYLIYGEVQKTMRNMAFDVTQFILHPGSNWKDWVDVSQDYFLLTARENIDTNGIIDKLDQQYNTINVKRHYFTTEFTIPKECNTIRQIKKEIFLKTGVPTKSLYFIDPVRDHKPGEDDDLDQYGDNSYDKYMLEIIMNTNDIEFLQKLDKGGCGEVTLFQHKVSNEKYVMKTLLNPEDDLYRDISKQYLIDKEVDAIKSGGLYHYGGEVGLSLEFMSRGNLRSYIQEKENQRLSEEESAKISYQILTQLENIHNLGIIHRDIKPENIVFDDHFNAKLIDYGISKRIEGLSEDELIEELIKSSPGTINYMAPEVFDEICGYNQKADIWSMGVLVTEMVTGKKPYSKLPEVKAGSFIKTKKAIDVKLSSSHSSEIQDFVRMCLNRVPEERPTAAALIQSMIIQKYSENN